MALLRLEGGPSELRASLPARNKRKRHADDDWEESLRRRVWPKEWSQQGFDKDDVDDEGYA